MINKVKGLIETGLSDQHIEPYVQTANVFLNKAFAGVEVDHELKEEIKAWVAAHYIALTRERVTKKEGAGSASVEYAGVYGESLMATQWGQTAVELDVTGTLKMLVLKKATNQIGGRPQTFAL